MTPAYYSIVSNNTEVLARRRCHGLRRLMMMMCVVCARLMAGASDISTPTSTSLMAHIYIGIHSTFFGRMGGRTLSFSGGRIFRPKYHNHNSHTKTNDIAPTMTAAAAALRRSSEATTPTILHIWRALSIAY